MEHSWTEEDRPCLALLARLQRGFPRPGGQAQGAGPGLLPDLGDMCNCVLTHEEVYGLPQPLVYTVESHQLCWPSSVLFRNWGPAPAERGGGLGN